MPSVFTFFNGMTLTDSQSRAIEAILAFLADEKARVFILKGYAGTGKTTIRIISAEGKAVIESSTNNNFIHYDISNLKPGVYMVQTVQNGQVTATGKLLVNK